MLGPNEDGAEAYREHLESLPCPTCGCREIDHKAAFAQLSIADRLAEAASNLKTGWNDAYVIATEYLEGRGKP